MTTELVDGRLVSELFSFYAPALADRFRSPVTGGALTLPSQPEQQANLLNLALHNPDAAILFSGTLPQAQLAIWQPYLAASRYKFGVFCARDKGGPQGERTLGRLPIYQAERGFEPKSFLHAASGLGALLYPSNNPLNIGYMRRSPSLLHVHIGHGDSDKHASGNRMNVSYDFIMLANQEAMDRYRRNGVEIEPSRFLPVGGGVVPGVVPRLATGLLNNVLYAPTFEGRQPGVNFSSIERAHAAMLAFGKKAPERLHCRLHPALGARDKAFLKLGRKIARRQATDPVMSKADAFNWSDVIVCDISGVQSEYLFTGKPIIIPVSPADGGWVSDYLSSTDTKRFAYLWDHRETSLISFLYSIAHDPLREARLARRQALFLGAESFDDSVAMFDDAIAHLLSCRTMRRRRQQSDARFRPELPPLAAHPDAELDRLVEAMRTGETMLHADPPILTEVVPGEDEDINEDESDALEGAPALEEVEG